VEYAFENSGSVRIRVLDLEGREVAKLVDGSVSSGRHEVSWSAGRVRAGIYSVVIEGPDRQIWTGKIVAAR
jgi:flagellar hook assembly protein FlgD